MTPDADSKKSNSEDASPGADPGPGTGSGERMVDPRLLEILVCPLTKSPLRFDAAARELISDQAGLAFPIRNGVPIMLVEEARRLSDAPGADDPVADGAAALAPGNAPGSDQ